MQVQAYTLITLGYTCDSVLQSRLTPDAGVSFVDDLFPAAALKVEIIFEFQCKGSLT